MEQEYEKGRQKAKLSQPMRLRSQNLNRCIFLVAKVSMKADSLALEYLSTFEHFETIPSFFEGWYIYQNGALWDGACW